MGFASSYLRKHAYFDPFVPGVPVDGTGIIVVIPCYNEPDAISAVNSLAGAFHPSFPVEVIMVVNAPENAPVEGLEQNKRTIAQLREWGRSNNHERFSLHTVEAPLFPSKHAGAGWARKTGMDEAVRRFNMAGNEKGIIVSFDADSLCGNNYFEAIEDCFRQDVSGCTIYFEHPLEKDGGEPGVIVDYELYLRYYVQAMRHAGFPWAFHTIGSCFAVTAAAYVKQGGMNRRKAGEDFYFLHKIFPLGNFTELNTTTVLPSSRVSDRVPFGTGVAVKKLSGGERRPLMTWPVKSFEETGELFRTLPRLFRASGKEAAVIASTFHPMLREYLADNRFVDKVSQINLNSASYPAFRKRFFRWFGGLMMLRYLNYARRTGRGDISVTAASAGMLDRLGVPGANSNLELLNIYRRLQKETVWRC